jgi:hypothetical protein
VTPEDIGAGLSVGFLLVFWLAMMALNIAIYVFYVWSLVDIAKTPPELFEWPGERVMATKPFWVPTVTPQVGYQPHPPAWPQVPPPRA